MLHCHLLVKQFNHLGAAAYGRFKWHQGADVWDEDYFSRHETIESQQADARIDHDLFQRSVPRRTIGGGSTCSKCSDSGDEVGLALKPLRLRDTLNLKFQAGPSRSKPVQDG